MKHLKKFENEDAKNAWLNGSEYVAPNVALTDGVVEYNLQFNPADVPLYVEAKENLTVSFGNTYEYSKDNATWQSGTGMTIISANAGEKVYFRASGLTATEPSGIGKFTITGTSNIGGNIMSMLYGEDYRGKTAIEQSYAFGSMFSSCKKLISAKNLALPATTLAENCYSYMFEYCTSLVDAPELLATTLAHACYNGMFRGCTSLVNAPELPATTLAEDCYSFMFNDCTSLVNAPELPVTTLADWCYSAMFYGCTSLVNAPELPATTLADNCYQGMFCGCINLNYIKAMFTTKPTTFHTSNWVWGVASTGTFVKNAAATWDVVGTSGIPEGWTVEYAES